MATTMQKLAQVAEEARALSEMKSLTPAQTKRLNDLIKYGQTLREIAKTDQAIDEFTGNVSRAIGGAAATPDAEGFAPGVGRITTKALKTVWDAHSKGGNVPSGQAFKVPGYGTKDIDSGTPDGGERIEPLYRDPEDYLLPMRPSFLTQIVPAKVVTGSNSFEYRRQSVRDNRAAVVDDGDTKPVSKYELTMENGSLDTIATMSDDIKTRVLQDEGGLMSWLSSEMSNGISLASEAELIAAILGDVLVQSQTFDTDAFTSLRKALTKLEKVFVTPDFVAVGLDTAEAMDLARYMGGDEHFVLDGPRAAGPTGAIWSTRLIKNPAIPEGIAVLGSAHAALRRYVNGAADWMIDPYTGFGENLVRARLEVREKSVVVAPFALVVVEVALGS
jgi:hypothetical protein